MKVAYIYEGKAVVQFTDEKFRQLLNDYFNQTRDIDKALTKLEEDLKQEILYI